MRSSATHIGRGSWSFKTWQGSDPVRGSGDAARGVFEIQPLHGRFLMHFDVHHEHL